MSNDPTEKDDFMKSAHLGLLLWPAQDTGLTWEERLEEPKWAQGRGTAGGTALH